VRDRWYRARRRCPRLRVRASALDWVRPLPLGLQAPAASAAAAPPAIRPRRVQLLCSMRPETLAA